MVLGCMIRLLGFPFVKAEPKTSTVHSKEVSIVKRCPKQRGVRIIEVGISIV